MWSMTEVIELCVPLKEGSMVVFSQPDSGWFVAVTNSCRHLQQCWRVKPQRESGCAVDPCVHRCSWCRQVLLSLCFPCSQSNKAQHAGDLCTGCLRGRALTPLLVLPIPRLTCCFPSVRPRLGAAAAVAVVKLLRVQCHGNCVLLCCLPAGTQPARLWEECSKCQIVLDWHESALISPGEVLYQGL